MQIAVREILTGHASAVLGKDTEPSPIIDDFGFNNDFKDVLSCWMALRNHHILPFAGGWLDQPISWRDDLQTMEAVYNEIFDIIDGKIPVISAAPTPETGAEIRMDIFDDGSQ